MAQKREPFVPEPEIKESYCRGKDKNSAEKRSPGTERRRKKVRKERHRSTGLRISERFADPRSSSSPVCWQGLEI